MRTKKFTPMTQEADKPITTPRLVKAMEFAAREAAQVEAERAREQAKQERTQRPAIRTPRNAVEARDIFNSLFNEAA